MLPPTVAEPMRRYSQPPPPPRTTRSTAAKVFGWILLALVIVVTGLAGGLYLYAHETLNAIAPHSAAVKKSQKDLAAVLRPRRRPALVIGYDARAGSEGFGLADSRSDTIMLIRADPQTNTLSLLSFPRDLQVPIYCDPTTAIKTDRINSAWSSCGNNGTRGTLDTVEKLTGIPVNYLITVNFHGFKLLVNKMHGVYMQVDHRYINTQSGPSGFATIDLEPGYQKLDGQQALDFVRFRHTDSDLYRLARQQLFLEALKDRLASSMSLTNIPPIIGALKHNIEIARGGSGGAPGFKEIESYAGLASKLGGGHLFRVQIPNLVDCGFLNAQVCTTTTDIQTAVTSFMHPDVTLPSRANAVALGRKPHEAAQPKLQRSQITALVLNGTTATGSPVTPRSSSGLQGFHTVLLPARSRPRADEAYVHRQLRLLRRGAEQTRRRPRTSGACCVGPHTVTAPLPPEIAPLGTAGRQPARRRRRRVVVRRRARRSAGDHRRDPRPSDPVGEKSTLGRSPTSSATCGRSWPFRPMVPTAVESHSRFTSLEPVRAYKPIAGHTRFCLTYVTGAGNVYWQVMETDWTDAPIIRHPTKQGDDRRSKVRPLYGRRQHPHDRAPPGERQLLGRQTRSATSSRTRRCSPSPNTSNCSARSSLPPQWRRSGCSVPAMSAS